MSKLTKLSLDVAKTLVHHFNSNSLEKNFKWKYGLFKNYEGLSKRGIYEIWGEGGKNPFLVIGQNYKGNTSIRKYCNKMEDPLKKQIIDLLFQRYGSRVELKD